MINEEINRAHLVNKPREFWLVVKCSIQGLGTGGDVHQLRRGQIILKIRESEYIWANKSNGSKDIELGRGTATYPLNKMIMI